MELIGSQTENNLRSAISGEAQAALLYWFFEKKARRDGFEELGDIFHEISENEKAHAKIYYDLLKCIGPSEKNLEASAESELHEHSKMYPQFAKTENGVPVIPAVVKQAWFNLAYASLSYNRYHELWRTCMGLFIAHWLTLFLQTQANKRLR